MTNGREPMADDRTNREDRTDARAGRASPVLRELLLVASHSVNLVLRDPVFSLCPWLPRLCDL
jgi:hypothetical protein